MNRIFSLIALVISINVYCQTKIWEKRIPLKEINEIVALKDNKTGDYDFIFSNNTQITPIRVDASFENSKIGWITSKGRSMTVDKPADNQYFIGELFFEDQLTLFYGNELNKQFGLIQLDYETGIYKKGPVLINLEDEKFAQSFSHMGKFYLLTSVKNSSILNLYVYNSYTDVKKIELDYSEIKYSSSYRDDVTLHNLLKEETNGLKLNVQLSLAKVDQNLPIPLSLTSNRCNLYKSQDRVYLTIDNRAKSTTVLSFSLLDYDISTFVFDGQGIESTAMSGDKTINSYVLNEKLFQLVVTPKELLLLVYDLNNGQLLKSYGALREEEINFRNSDFYLEATNSFWGERAKRISGDETKKIISKIRKGDAALVVREVSEKLELKIGGYRQITNNVSGMGGIPIGGGIFLSSSYRVSDEQDYFFKSYLDPVTLNHEPIEQIEGVPSIIGNLKTSLKLKDVVETIFSDGEKTFWCYYDTLTSIFHLYEIE